MLTSLVIFGVAMRCLVVEGVAECIGECHPSTENNIISYLPHNDCNKYCVCVSGQPEVMECNPEDHWSPDLEICTHPAEARCQPKNVNLGCVSECPDYNVLIGHHFCSKYCKCIDSQASVENCPAGLYFSTENHRCVIFESSDCAPESLADSPIEPPIRPPTEPPTKPPTEPPTRPPTEPPTRPPTEPPTRPPTRPPNRPTEAPVWGCIADCPGYDILIGHHNCNQYCECKGSKVSLKTCPSGTYFSTEWQQCLTREDSDCPENPATEPPTRPPTRPPARPPTRPPTRPPPVDSKGCIGECPLCNDPDKTVHIPHEDEHKFCKCNWGKPVVFTCPDGLVFNAKEEVCDYPWGPGCPNGKCAIKP